MQIKLLSLDASLHRVVQSPLTAIVHLLRSLTWMVASVILLLQMTACVGPLRQRVLYEYGGIQIGLETDLTVQRASPPALNAHPYNISSDDMRVLLGSLEVSGWSGIVLGLFQNPRPIPVFSTAELEVIAKPIAEAFQLAAGNERVFFSIPGTQPPYPYQKEKTVGALLFRDRYLHVLLTNHYAFAPTDPGGGEERDPRDTKGMKLWVTPPAQAATVPDNKEPDWSAFEKVHISLNPDDVLAARAPAGTAARVAKPAPGPTPSAPTQMPPAVSTQARPAVADALREPSAADDLRLQLRELTNANMDLRSHLEEQRTEIDTLRQELDRLRKELKSRLPQKPSNQARPAP